MNPARLTICKVAAAAALHSFSVRLRDLPSVDELVRGSGRPARGRGRAGGARARARGDPGRCRARRPAGAARQALAAARRPALRRVLNATGVLVHTNLGRAPLAQAALDRIATRAGYSNLEYDLSSGSRGSRQDHLAPLLRRLTGAEAAIVVNNNAAAMLLALAALAEGREVVVSRGELIEIGDGFRIPDVLARSGARLVEVGTTNRTRAADYERAIGPETALLLRVHQSNFRVVGFTEQPRLDELAAVARRHELPLLDDLGLRRARRRRGRADAGRRPRRRRRPRLLLGRQAARRPAGRDRRRPRRPGREAAPASAPPRPALGQADARGARGNARALPRPAGRDPGAADAARARRGRPRPRRAPRGGDRRRRRGDRRARRRRRAAARRAAELRLRGRGGAGRRTARARAAGDRGRPRRAHAARLPDAHRRRGRRGRGGGRTHAADGRHRRAHRPRQDVARAGA